MHSKSVVTELFSSVLGLLEEIVKKVSENGIESGEFEGVEETSKNKNELQLLTGNLKFCNLFLSMILL